MRSGICNCRPLREASGFPFRLEADSVAGLLAAAMVGIVAVEFIGYWAHRIQHRFLFFWRMHATHHHITKMSVARADRTHPLEFPGLNLGSAVALAFLGASADVVAVVLVFRLTTAHVNHCNLPLTSGAFGLVFNTAEWHRTTAFTAHPTDSPVPFECGAEKSMTEPPPVFGDVPKG